MNRMYRQCWGGHGDVSLDRVDGGWEVLELCSDAVLARRHRLFITAFIDFLCA